MKPRTNPKKSVAKEAVDAGMAERQRRAAALIASGKTARETAEEMGVGIDTIWRWQRTGAPFQEAATEIAQGAVDSAKGRIAGLVGLAFTALETLLTESTDDKIRLDAAKTTLDRFGYPATEKHEHDTGPSLGVVVTRLGDVLARKRVRDQEREQLEAGIEDAQIEDGDYEEDSDDNEA